MLSMFLLVRNALGHDVLATTHTADQWRQSSDDTQMGNGLRSLLAFSDSYRRYAGPQVERVKTRCKHTSDHLHTLEQLKHILTSSLVLLHCQWATTSGQAIEAPISCWSRIASSMRSTPTLSPGYGR
jgi:hypothetical protein